MDRETVLRLSDALTIHREGIRLFQAGGFLTIINLGYLLDTSTILGKTGLRVWNAVTIDGIDRCLVRAGGFPPPARSPFIP